MSRSNFPRRPASEGRAHVTALALRGFATVRRTPGLLLISLALAIAIWVFVTEEENPTRSGLFPSQIAVEPVNVGQSLAVANVLPSVDVRIQAPDDRWDDLTSANFRAIVDLNGLDAREQTVPVRVEVSGVRGVRVLAVDPPTVEVNLEGIVSRIVSVEPRLVGSVPRGFEVQDVITERLTVEISGPESLVALVERAEADVIVSGLAVSLEELAQLVARGEGGGEISGVTIEPPAVTVSVTIQQTALTRAVPLEVSIVGEPAPGYRLIGVAIQPAVVSVEGTFDTLQAIDSISLGQVVLDGKFEDETVTLAPDLPAGVIAAVPAEVEVTLSFGPVEGSTVLILVPEAIDVPEGLIANLGDQLVTVVLDGPLPVLNGLVAGDVRAEVDLAGLAAGTTEVAVRVFAPDGVTVREVRPALLSVTLEPAPAEGEG